MQIKRIYIEYPEMWMPRGDPRPYYLYSIFPCEPYGVPMAVPVMYSLEKGDVFPKAIGTPVHTGPMVMVDNDRAADILDTEKTILQRLAVPVNGHWFDGDAVLSWTD